MLRFRRATQEDVTFLLSLHQSLRDNLDLDKSSVAADVHFKNVTQNSLFRRNRKVAKDQKVRHRVRPHPDPARLDQTTWMTRDEIQFEALKPSKKWVDAGSGTMGTVFLEIIGCDDLPNMVSHQKAKRTHAKIRRRSDSCSTLKIDIPGSWPQQPD